MAIESETMLPCPHCGQQQDVGPFQYGTGFQVEYRVVCGDIECGAMVFGHTAARARLRWNRRAPSAEAKDAERLDFVLANGAFLYDKRADSGAMTYQLMAQDEDENHAVLHDDRWYADPRDAIDAAIAQQEASR